MLVFCLGQVLTESCGDVNSDGFINIVDALLIALYYINLNPENFNESVADMNEDGMIDIVDALLIAQYDVGLITGFPCNPDPDSKLTGRWNLDSYVNLVLNSEQTIYDHGTEEWSGVVEMSGYVDDTIITNVQIRQGSSSSGPGIDTKFTLTTDNTIYPHYTIKLFFNNHPFEALESVYAVVQENETTSIVFNQDFMYSTPFTWEANILMVNLDNIVSVDGTATLSFGITLNREKTLILYPYTLHTCPYPPYDAIYYISITGSSFNTGFIYQGDMGIDISGTVEITDNMVILDFNPYYEQYDVSPPIIMEMITMDDVLYLKRVVTKPSDQEICDFYGITPSALESFDYYQLYIHE